MVRDLSNIDKALGDGTKKLLEAEKDPMFKMRKSIIIKTGLPQGTSINRSLGISLSLEWVKRNN